jgi:hypothetical protein
VVATCDLDPLVLVTITWTVEAVLKVHASVALPDPVKLVGEIAHDVLLVVRLTSPVNPLLLVTAMAEVPAIPTPRVTSVGFALIVKSVTANETVKE